MKTSIDPPTPAEMALVRQLEDGRLQEEARTEQERQTQRMASFLANQAAYYEWRAAEKRARADAKRQGIDRPKQHRAAPKPPRSVFRVDDWDYRSAPARYGVTFEGVELTGVQEWILDRVVRGHDPSKGVLQARLGARFPELKRLVHERSRREYTSAEPKEQRSPVGEGNRIAQTASITDKDDVFRAGKSSLGSELKHGFAVAPPLPDQDRKRGKGRPQKVRPQTWLRNDHGGAWRPLGPFAGVAVDPHTGKVSGKPRFALGPGVDDPTHKAAAQQNDVRAASAMRPSRGGGFGDPAVIAEQDQTRERGPRSRQMLRAALIRKFGDGIEPWTEYIDKAVSRYRVAGRRRQDRARLIAVAMEQLPADTAQALAEFAREELGLVLPKSRKYRKT